MDLVTSQAVLCTASEGRASSEGCRESVLRSFVCKLIYLIASQERLSVQCRSDVRYVDVLQPTMSDS